MHPLWGMDILWNEMRSSGIIHAHLESNEIRFRQIFHTDKGN